LRRAEIHTFVSSKTIGLTTFGLDLSPSRGNVSLDLRRRPFLGPSLNAFEQDLEILQPLLFGIKRDEANCSFAEFEMLERL